jgi:hypothetical protein
LRRDLGLDDPAFGVGCAAFGPPFSCRGKIR